MNLQKLKPRKSLNKAFLKVKPNRSDIEVFKANLIRLIDETNDTESEEFHKNLVADFLKKTYFEPNHFINTKGKTDLVIHNGKNPKSTVGVLIEAKKPTNKAEMLQTDKLNVKAVHELMLYYLRERITLKNLDIHYLIVTNINEWFIFDATVFEKNFAQNKNLVRQFEDFENGRLSGTTTDFFYKNIAEVALDKLTTEIEFTHFDLRDYEKPLKNNNKKDDTKLIALYKLLSPEHLLKLPFANDSNSLDKKFYSELLHIIGLSETKKGGKKIIERNKPADRTDGSLLENAVNKLDSLGKISRLTNAGQYGETRDERLFNVGLELAITWVNRILFLKLLEAQLIAYHKGDTSYAFLNFKKVSNYDDLSDLFFGVLAKRQEDRSEKNKTEFAKVPYLNSSLFELSELEHEAISVGNLRDEKTLPILSTTVLKNEKGKKRTGELNALEYFFAFLDAYDFSSEGAEDIQEGNKTLINASVLGLIFEKINGYKDGSFFTPGFITMYMCRETIRRAVVQKFNDAKGWNCQTIKDIYELSEDRNEANAIINSLKICDPAVGSGHFLVSALNEIIAIKNDLKILQDRQGQRLKEYHFEVVNDELVVTDENGELFEYVPNSRESQRVQEALFHEKQTIIENCLFGVDINPNSVKICRLRLWIELLKNAYYKAPSLGEGAGGEVSGLTGFQNLQGLRTLETLPNIDINIKCGNSLISRFGLDADIKYALKKSKWTIDSYRLAVDAYRNAQSKEEKREMERLIEDIKSDFRSEISKNDPKVKKLYRFSGELAVLTTQTGLFDMGVREKRTWNKKVKELTAKTRKLETEIDEIKNNTIYENAFEWRFEFPEVLNNDGDFVGFDVVIGNPPYIRQEEIKEFKSFFKSQFSLYSGTADVYVFFIEKGFEILKHKGIFTFIMPNKFMQAGYGQSARAFLLKQNLIEIVDFGDYQVFEEATTYPCILTASKNQPEIDFKTSKIESKDYLIDFPNYVAQISNKLNHSSLTDETWIISTAEDQELLLKINAVSEKLENFIDGESKRGVVTGLTEAFIIDEETKNQILNEDTKSSEIVKPVVRGRDIQKWYSQPKGVYLISTFPTLNLEIDEFQGVKNHLLTFGKNRLEQSGNKDNRKKTSGKWFETQDNIAYWQEFEKPKIMYQVMQVKPCFIYDEEGLYCNNSMWIIPSDDKVLLGILNSRMGWWLISKYCTQIQNGYQLIWKYFSQIPIAIGNEDVREEIEQKVNQILALKKADSAADTSALEAEIDALVYELYGLTEEEIKIVEEAVR